MHGSSGRGWRGGWRMCGGGGGVGVGVGDSVGMGG
jgi:hypothetical protein